MSNKDEVDSKLCFIEADGKVKIVTPEQYQAMLKEEFDKKMNQDLNNRMRKCHLKKM